MPDDTGHQDTPAIIGGGDREEGGRRTRRLAGSFFHYTPGLFYILIVLVVIKAVGIDVRMPRWSGAYALTIAEMLYALAGLISVSEMLKVSHPGVNNIGEVFGMIAIAVVFILLLVLGAVNAKVWLVNFGGMSTSETLVLTVIAVAQAIIGAVINTRTLVRQISDARL